MLFFDHNSGNVPFSSDEMGILSVGIHEDDTKTNINVRLLSWIFIKRVYYHLQTTPRE